MEPADIGAYPPTWETDVVLADGHTVRVRPIVPDDAERLVRFHHRQSAESVYFRYFSPRPRLSERDVRHFTTVDHRDRVAFVAVIADEIIAVARYERYRGTDTAEVAFFVDDEHHGRGLATLLLEYLAAAAIDNGLGRFAATTLPNNRKMLGVFQNAGYEVSSRLEDGVVEIGFDLDQTGETLAAIDRRERAAEAASVRPMLEPRSVAVIGAGRERGGLGAEVFANLRVNGFTGALFPVNHHADQVDGVEALRAVSDLPDDVDLVLIATPAASVPGIIEECGERGVRSVVVLSAGFAEAGSDGSLLQDRVRDAARRAGLRLLGPNCLGVINTDPTIRLAATLAPEMPLAGGVAIMAEAGTLAAGIVDHAARMELGLSTMVAAGNRADVSASDLLSYWTEDVRTRAVLMYLAARHLQPRFVRAARAASLRQPVAALHTSMAASSRSPQGGEAAGRARAMFRQTGVIGVSTLEQLFDVGRIVADQPVPAGAGVVVIGNSDGAVSLAADACIDAGLELVPLEVSAGADPRSNPIDLGYDAGAAAFGETLAEVTRDPRVHSVVVVYTPPLLGWDQRVAEAVGSASASAPEVTFAATMLGAAGRARLHAAPGTLGAAERSVPIFRFPEDAARAIGRLVEYRAWREAADGATVTGSASGDVAAAKEVLDPIEQRCLAAGDPSATVALELGEQARLLAAYGVDLIPREVATDVDAAVIAADHVGWPVALKAATRDRLTRSTASGVVLDVADEEQLRATWQRMWDALGPAMLPVVVQRFSDSGLDVAIEVQRDELGSGTVRVGLGGPARILDEYDLGVLPLTLADASSLVATSPVGRVLTDPLERVPLVETVHRLAAMVEHHDGLRSVVVDPTVVSPMWARVADVEIHVGVPVDDFAVRRLE